MFSIRQRLLWSAQALRQWDRRQWTAAVVASVVTALLIGFATVLIPNPIFGREIPPEPWNYWVWPPASALTGMVMATYVSPETGGDEEPDEQPRRTSVVGAAGAFAAWFAVGCPVCNKIALIALGYSGAMTYFAPVQPLLGALAIVLSGIALIWRLSGQIVCAMPTLTPADQSPDRAPSMSE